MSPSNQIGLSHFELEREFNWLSRKVPKEYANLLKPFGDAIISLIVKNNEAIAKNLATLNKPESTEDF